MEILELKVIINRLKIEVLELTNRVLALEKNETSPIIGGFQEPLHFFSRKSALCNNGHNLDNGHRSEGRTLMCDICKRNISLFTSFKSCRECDYDICYGCYMDIPPSGDGYSVPITFVNPPNSQGWSGFKISPQNGQTIHPPLNRDPFPLVNTSRHDIQFPPINQPHGGHMLEKNNK